MRETEMVKTGIGMVAPVNDLDWRFVYNTLGLLHNFQDFVSQIESPQDGVHNGGGAHRWKIPVILGLSIDALIVAHRSLGGGVCSILDAASQNSLTHKRDPKNGSYAVWLRQTIDADPDLASLSIERLHERGIETCTLLEYLLASFALRFTQEKYLDKDGTVTICGGSRAGSRVPICEYNARQDTIHIGWFSTSSSGKTFRGRQVFTQA